MTAQLREAAQELLKLTPDDSSTDWNVAFNKLHAALSQPEPVGELTDGEIYTEWSRQCQKEGLTTRTLVCNFARAILARTSAPAATHLFELWWAEYMPDATQQRAWEAWTAAPRADGVGVASAPAADGRGTDAQIEKEREIAGHAIVGALAAGYAGAKHPGADHWLASAHEAGVRIKQLECIVAEPRKMMGDGVVRVCPLKDAECGDRPSGWCDECPKRAPAAEQAEPVGRLTVSHYKGLENRDFDYFGSLPDGTYSLYTHAQPARELLTPAELDLCRQWFDAVQDLNAPYLTKPDYMLAEKLYRALEMRVPSGITAQAGETQS